MHILKAIEELGRLVFTTAEVASIAGISLSSADQRLGSLKKAGVIGKIKRGVWGKVFDKNFDPLMVIPFLLPTHRCYLSFLSVLHKTGIIGQIPQEITVASTAHSKKIKTPVGMFVVYRIQPDFFDGFVLSKNGAYYMATPEKALVDALYLSGRKGRKFSHFPEMDFSGNFDFKKAMAWAKKIRDPRIKELVLHKIGRLQRL